MSATPAAAAAPIGGPLDAALPKFTEWDSAGSAALVKMTSNPWRHEVFPRRFIELVSVAINAACTNLNAEGTRRHIRAALAAGASRDQLLTVLKMASGLSIHSCSLGAPILLEEAKLAEASPKPKAPVPTPACDKMRAAGIWNSAWDPFFELDPAWTDEFMAFVGGVYVDGGVFTPKEAELLSIAFDASFTHMYPPGTRRHIKSALKAGASVEEIMEVLKLCVIQGAQAANLGVPILAEELARAASSPSARSGVSN